MREVNLAKASVTAPEDRRGATGRTQALLFLLVFGTNLFFNQGGDWNQNTRLDLTRAIVEGHTFCIDKYTSNTFDRRVHNGHIYCDKAPGLSLMAVPAYFTVYHAGRLLGGSPDSDLFNILTVYLTRALTVYLIAAIGAVVFFRLVFLLSNDLAASIITTIGCALGTLMLPYGMVFYGHVVGAVFCLTAFYLVFTLRHGCGKPRPWLRAGGAGLLLGLSVISEYPTIILAVLIGIYALPVLRRSAWAALLCGALPLVGLMLYNQTCFGSPLATGYDGYLNAPAGFFSKMRMGLYGLSMPSLGVLYSLTFSPYRGLFMFCPFLVLGLVGLYYMVRERRFRREAALFIAAGAAFLLLNASYAYWHGGSSIGPRHLTPIVPYLAAAAVFVVSRYRGVSVYAIVVSASMLVMMVTVTHGVSEYKSRPIYRTVQMLQHGHISATNLGVFTRNDTIPREWNAFNLGELMGLDVLPVLLLLIALVEFVRFFRRSAISAPEVPPGSGRVSGAAAPVEPEEPPKVRLAGVEPANRQSFIKIQVALFLLVYGTNLYFNQGGDWNQNTRLDLTRAIVEGHTLCIDKYARNTGDRCLHRGHFYCDKAPGLSFLAVPPYFAVYHIGRLFGASPQDDLFNIVTVYLTRALTVYLIAAFGVLIVFRLAYLLSGDLRAAVLTSLGYALGTLALPYGMLFYGHIMGAVCCLAAFYLVFVYRHGYTNRSPTRTALWVGLLLGSAIVSEYLTVMLAVIIGLYACASLRWNVLVAVACAAPLGGVLLVYNDVCFGNLLMTGYQVYVSAEVAVFPMFKKGIAGLVHPSLRTLYGLTFSTHRGLFVFSPFLLLGPIGLLYMAGERRLRAEAAVVAAGGSALLLFNCCMVGWTGGACVGPRYLTPVVPMLSAAAALAVCRHRAVSKLLVLVSALMLLIMVTVAQGVEDSEQHPIYSLYRTYLMGEVSIGDNAAFTRNNTIPRVSNSFNLGELVGMLPRTTILPILAFWYAMAMVLSILVERAKGRSLSAPG